MAGNTRQKMRYVLGVDIMLHLPVRRQKMPRFFSA